jgi:3-isopropylmalate/(R)-2-methylmalate dehydratase large subunit
MPQTMVEKLISKKVGRNVKSGELVVASIDLLVSHDGNRPQAPDIFKELGGDKVFDNTKVKLVIDHAPNVPNQAAASIHQSMRKFANEQGAEIIGPGEGICHQIIPERGYVAPGDLVLGTDSHTCTYGAFNVFGTGVGSSDLAAAMLTGKLWLRVPESIKIVLSGTRNKGVTPKDIVLYLVKKLRADGATYKALEFTGEGLQSISVSGRMTMSNMAVEMGAKTAIFPCDEVLEEWLQNHNLTKDYEAITADDEAVYEREIIIDLGGIQPQIAIPSTVDNVKDLVEAEGEKISQAVIGTCTNGRLEDLRDAASILIGQKIHSEVRLFVTPASREVYIQALQEGIISTLVEAGAVIGVPGCSGCSGGAHFAIPSDDDVVITSANRNFIGRLGNPKARIYLASPATVAMSALVGRITSANKVVS